MKNQTNTATIDWVKAIIGGIAGTLLFDFVGYLLGEPFFKTAGMIGMKTGLGLAYGVFGHYMNGILLAILYAGIAPSLWGPSWFRTFLFVAGETIGLVFFFLYPMLDMGIAGIDKGVEVMIVSSVKHLSYGIPLWYFVHIFKNTQDKKNH